MSDLILESLMRPGPSTRGVNRFGMTVDEGQFATYLRMMRLGCGQFPYLIQVNDCEDKCILIA